MNLIIVGVTGASLAHQLPCVSGRVTTERSEHPAVLRCGTTVKTAMNRFQVRIALRQYAPLNASIESPENGFEYLAGGNRLAA